MVSGIKVYQGQQHHQTLPEHTNRYSSLKIAVVNMERVVMVSALALVGLAAVSIRILHLHRYLYVLFLHNQIVFK